MDRERLAETILGILPLMFKRIMREFPSLGISHQQLGLLFMVHSHNDMPMSFYSDRMMVSRPNLTVIADKLIGEGLLERKFDPNDRRIIALSLTGKGRQALAEHRNSAIRDLSRKLGNLDDGDAERLNEILVEMKTIFDRIEPNRTEHHAGEWHEAEKER